MSFPFSLLRHGADAVRRATLPFFPVERKDPEELLGQLFHDVQDRQVYPDGKTFADVIPKKRWKQIQQEYALATQDPQFNLEEFLTQHFFEFDPPAPALTVTPAATARDHVTALWPQLTRRSHKASGSLFPLPHPYVVPGGRFAEQFYWDSYFIMLGLAADGQWDLVEGMVKNCVYMIRRLGFIPTANRSYFTSRSQPPVFAHMVQLLTQRPGAKAAQVYKEYLPSLIAEYEFWMSGGRVVPGRKHLNRYFDDRSTPRPESRREDLHTAQKSLSPQKEKVFVDLRAAAESGWDFSSRWFDKPREIETIRTTDIIPVDLNCLLYDLEMTIATALGDAPAAATYAAAAARRAKDINELCFNEADGFYCDVVAATGEHTGKLTLAGVFPLFSGIASKEQATRVADRLRTEFLAEGGLLTTTINTGEQWDAPNGWAPLQWVAICGLRRYHIEDLAEQVRMRWLRSVEIVFDSHCKMIEKYDVTSPERLGGGGEYPLQDGFGWTNGVYAALYDDWGR